MAKGSGGTRTSASNNPRGLTTMVSQNGEKVISDKLDSVLSRFPDDATSWRDANDEVRDIANASYEFLVDYDELDRDTVPDLNFRSLTTPSQWNTRGKAFIRSNLARMSQPTRRRFYEWLDERF